MLLSRSIRRVNYKKLTLELTPSVTIRDLQRQQIKNYSGEGVEGIGFYNAKSHIQGGGFGESPLR